MKNYPRILAALTTEAWAIEPQWLDNMLGMVTDRTTAKEYIALQAKNGTPLEHTRSAEYIGSTAILAINGPIFPKADILSEMSGALSLESLSRDMVAAEQNPDIKNIVFKIHSPGGSVVGLDEFVALTRTLTTPTHGHITGNCASAAYWIASNFDNLSMSPASSAGSIGVIMSTTKAKDGEEAKNLTFVSSVSPDKNLDPNTKKGAEAVYRTINSIAEVFVADVSVGREVSIETVKKSFGKGGMLTGQEAVDAGMVDRIDTFEALMARLEEPDNSSHGDTQMNRKDYKAQFPEEHSAILAEGAASAQGSLATLQAQVDTLTATNKGLETDLAASADSLKVLERKETARTERTILAESEGIVASALTGSKIPARLHAKVQASLPGYEAFVSEDSLDAKAFGDALATEITGWEKDLGPVTAVKVDGEETLAGFGTGGEESVLDDDDATADAAVDRLLGFTTQKQV